MRLRGSSGPQPPNPPSAVAQATADKGSEASRPLPCCRRHALPGLPSARLNSTTMMNSCESNYTEK